MKWVMAAVAAFLVSVTTMIAPGAAQQKSLVMLEGLDPGNWELRMRGSSGEVETMCLRDARRLIQLRHPAEKCSSVVLDDTSSEVTVQYTCPGRGYGRTHIRRESSRLAQINSQGIANGLPFAFAAEARRVGDCRN